MSDLLRLGCYIVCEWGPTNLGLLKLVPSINIRLPTKGMEGLVENPPHHKALRRSQVDKLPVAFVYPPNLGVAEVRRVLSVPHVGEDQVGALVAVVHLSEQTY